MIAIFCDVFMTLLSHFRNYPEYEYEGSTEARINESNFTRYSVSEM